MSCFSAVRREAQRRGGRQYQIYASTEQGVAMLSSVLRSETVMRANIEIMCACGARR